MSELPSVPGYKLISLLGEGGMGRVYLAEDVTLGRRTAIKFVSDRMSTDPDARARFLREARTMATVEHAHVVRVYSFGEAGGSAYLVMEYVAGESLSERLKRTRQLDATEAIKITRQVAEALDAAWEQNLVHRDIKPSNILIDTKGQVRVADFGLAKPLDASATGEGLTEAGSILGTPHYLSPEQARGHEADIRSDIYSLGIVFYEMLAGERPFEGKTAFDIAARHMTEPLPELQARRPDLAADVITLVSFMTEKDPLRRPQTYAVLRERLRMLGEAGRSTPIPTRITAAVPQTRSLLGRWKWRLMAGSILLIAGAAYWASLDRTAEAPPTDERLVVAVTPFSGPDEDSAKEGKVMAALIERAINERLLKDDVRVVGIDQTKDPVKDHAAARALGERLGANAVIWGEAFALRGETEIQPYLTLVPRRITEKKASVNLGSGGRDPLGALAESSGTSLVMGAQAPNQIELRKTGAAGVSDLVLTLAASHALAAGHADKALALFKQAPRTSLNLRRRAEALRALNQTDEALAALTEAVALDPVDAQAQASLGDALLTNGRFSEAVAAYTKAAASGRPYRSREAILNDGRLYRRETFREFFQGRLQTSDSLYMLALDPKTGLVLERYSLPGTLVGLSPSGSGTAFEVSYQADEFRAFGEPFGEPFEAAIEFAHGAFTRPVFLPVSLLGRRRLATSGRELGRNFEPVAENEADFRPRGKHGHVPKDFKGLEETLLQSRALDPTQPWFLFLQGQAAWGQGRKEEAEARWRQLLDGAFPGVCFGTYTFMARDFERYGQPAWADRAYEEALKRRTAQPPMLHAMTLIDRLISFPIGSEAARALRLGGDPERGHLWLDRARKFGGFTESEHIAAAIWEEHFKKQGKVAEAEVEAAIWRRTVLDPMNHAALGPRLDHTITLFLSLNVAAWVGVWAFLALGRQRTKARGTATRSVRAAVAELSGHERRVAVSALLMAVAAYAPMALQARRIEAFIEFPIGLPDSLGSAETIRWADRLVLESRNKPAAHFVAGVAHHLAGDRDGARRLYEAIAFDPRARSNLLALAKGQLTPPEAANGADVIEVLAGKATLVNTLRLRGLTEILDGKNPISPVLVGTLFLAAVLGLWVGITPFRGALGACERPSRWHKLLPGILDLRGGSPLRGQLTLSLATGSLVALTLVQFSTQAMPSSGLVTAKMAGWGVLRAFPVPPHSPWTEFWAQPGAVAYWSCVGLAVVGAIILQVLALRQARKRNHAGTPIELDLSSQDTRVRG